jgi:hypothetical protein
MTMRLRFGIAVLVVLLGYIGFLAWRAEHIPALPARPQHQLADFGAVKSDLFVFARAERAFYASVGRYASMQELRSEGLLSLPPDIRWPYFYSIHTPAPDRFVIVAIAQGPFGARPIAITIDDDFKMQQFDAHHWQRPDRQRNRAPARQRFS